MAVSQSKSLNADINLLVFFQKTNQKPKDNYYPFFPNNIETEKASSPSRTNIFPNKQQITKNIFLFFCQSPN